MSTTEALQFSSKTIASATESPLTRTQEQEMHPITVQVREMYNAYPYPPQDVGLRMDGFPRLLLSYVERGPRIGRPLAVLDAGCGTGGSTLAMAKANPEIRFVGADMNSVALGALEQERALQRIDNLQLRNIDLMEPPEDLAPAGGFDVILLSGVLHHLVDPKAALRTIARFLAPDGVMVFMLYGQFGRTPALRVREAFSLAFGIDRSLSERVSLGRRVLGSLNELAVCTPPWDDGPTLDDTEFVDRYLHVQEVSYSVKDVYSLLEDAELRFLRWLEPKEWDLQQILRDPEIVTEWKKLPLVVQYSIVERLVDRPALTFVACHKDTKARKRPSREELLTATISWNPQAVIAFVRRSIDGKERVETAHAQVRNQSPLALSLLQAIVADFLVIPNRGNVLLEEVGKRSGCSQEEVLVAVEQLLDEEVLFVP